jgi:hypothetical protein
MKIPKKVTLIAAIGAISGTSWMIGVVMGYSSAFMRSVHANLGGEAIILMAIEDGNTEGAANWCKSFISAGSKALDREPSWREYLTAYFGPKPKLSRSLSDKVDQVATTYRPNIIDIEGEIKRTFGSGVEVKVQINE